MNMKHVGMFEGSFIARLFRDRRWLLGGCTYMLVIHLSFILMLVVRWLITNLTHCHFGTLKQ
jgi:hypothetical protein